MTPPFWTIFETRPSYGPLFQDPCDYPAFHRRRVGTDQLPFGSDEAQAQGQTKAPVVNVQEIVAQR